jgi:hypothetical protein
VLEALWSINGAMRRQNTTCPKAAAAHMHTDFKNIASDMHTWNVAISPPFDGVETIHNEGLAGNEAERGVGSRRPNFYGQNLYVKSKDENGE